MMSITIHWFMFVSHSVAIFLCATGRVDWWAYIMVILLNIKINSTFHK